ncbi:hypothetical protein GCM10010246_81530 [Streptomyces cuspidosporus]|uniref:RNHCP domain-containing protein n=1 Tax=Streptomyces cuspidosporus TaxID=66882 RepID=A0ABN3HAU3_9ACTN
MDAEREDRYERSASKENHREPARALKRLERLGQGRGRSPGSGSAETHEGYHPQHNPAGLDLQYCPVCNYTAFSPEAGHGLGMQIGTGQCLVCHYERSSAIAEGEARAIVYDARFAHD